MFKNPLNYEELDGDMVTTQVNYDWDGVITQIFVYSEYMDGLVEVNLETFEKRYPSKFSYLQSRINTALNIDCVNALN